ncbi:hypothetical protein GCM10027056_28800 [Glaciibacter psychrotolerans]
MQAEAMPDDVLRIHGALRRCDSDMDRERALEVGGEGDLEQLSGGEMTEERGPWHPLRQGGTEREQRVGRRCCGTDAPERRREITVVEARTADTECYRVRYPKCTGVEPFGEWNARCHEDEDLASAVTRSEFSTADDARE